MRKTRFKRKKRKTFYELESGSDCDVRFRDPNQKGWFSMDLFKICSLKRSFKIAKKYANKNNCLIEIHLYRRKTGRNPYYWEKGVYEVFPDKQKNNIKSKRTQGN